MMASELNEKIDDLDDVMDAYDLMDELNISTTGLTSLEDAKTRLRVHVNKNLGGRKSQPNQDAVTQLLKTDQARRDKLMVLYKKIRHFLNRLPESKMADLQTAFPNLNAELDRVEKNLEHNKCAILVAGETSAGKSTLLNLLLGQTKHNLLPVAHLSVTSVICELKYGTEPYAVAHPWSDDRDGRAVHISLTSKDAEKTLSGYIYQKFDRGKKFPFQRVEIFWPSEWLRAGVTIVDSPGIGESEEMTSLVKEYMPKAFGFIYVINPLNAGGIQSDRLQDLLLSYMGSEECKKNADEGGTQFDPRSAIFVANKWELVPQKEREEVKEMIYSQLGEIWTGLSKSQVFFLSAKQALDSMQEGVVNDDYSALLDGVETLLPIGLMQAITRQFSQVSVVMQNATRMLRTYVTQLEVSDIEREATCEEVLKGLRKIEKRPKDIEAELHKMQEKEINTGVDELKAHLSKSKVIEHICRWEESHCPQSTKVDALEELMYAYALKRIRNEINTWDKEKKVFEGIQKRLLDTLKAKFLSLESELANVERMMIMTEVLSKGDVGSMIEQSKEDEANFTTTEKVILGATAPIWIPLGLVVGMFALPVYGIKQAFRKRAEKKQLKEYNENKAREMKSVTKMVLSSMLDTSDLKGLLAEKIEMTLFLVKQMVSRIPDMIEADKQIIEKLKQKRSDDDLLLQELYPLQEEALFLQGKMDLMYMLDIRSYDINEHDLVGWKETDKPVAQGNFAKIYKASLAKAGEYGTTECAVKVLKDCDTQIICPITELNASDALLEENNLRRLQHKHVVKYFGTALKSNGSLQYVLMVMEFCACSLESYMENREEYTPPGDCQSGENVKSSLRAADLAWQIADGIDGIHTLGFLHRDLKPANILMTHDGQIRLADLGLSKAEKKITGTLVGTLLYMAPEIINQGKYDRSADMFSYGLILWELWYGSNVYDVYKLNNLRTLSTQAFKKERAPAVGGVWRNMMTGCWRENPRERPAANTCKQQFEEYKKKLQSKK